jgi:hypothetical protein
MGIAVAPLDEKRPDTVSLFSRGALVKEGKPKQLSKTRQSLVRHSSELFTRCL